MQHPVIVRAGLSVLQTNILIAHFMTPRSDEISNKNLSWPGAEHCHNHKQSPLSPTELLLPLDGVLGTAGERLERDPTHRGVTTSFARLDILPVFINQLSRSLVTNRLQGKTINTPGQPFFSFGSLLLKLAK